MDSKLMFLVLVFFLVLGIFSAFVFNNRVQQTKATVSDPPIAGNSFILVSSQGSECTVNPIARDKNEKGVEGLSVQITSTLGTVEAINPTTNDSGIAEFKVTSSTAGIGDITAEIVGLFTIPTEVSCTFSP